MLLAVRASRAIVAQRGMRASRDMIREKMLSLVESPQYAQTQGTTELVADERAPVNPFEGLTDRERSIALLVSEGLDNKEIASQLFLSEGTVRNNISAILQKKQLKNRTQLAVLCLSK